MKNTSQDVRFFAEAVAQLQEYLLSNELYWPLSGSLPRLTPGAALLTLARLSVFQPAEAQKMSYQFDSVRLKWRSAWEKKVEREIGNRMRLWSEFVADITNSPDRNADSFPNEARGRAILQLLLAELPDAQERSNLAVLDSTFKSRFIPGDFLWDAELQVVFPKTDFWFLYGKL
jgi:hypothetical protein